MAGRTRRTRKTETTEAPEQAAEATVEAGTETVQEEATEAPDTQQEADVTVTETEAPEAQEAEQAPEQAAENTEAQASAEPQGDQSSDGNEAEAEKEKTPDQLVDEFKSVVDSIIGEHADKETGHIAEEPMSLIVASYRAIPGTPKKGEGAAWVADEMRVALVETRDMSRAAAMAAVNQELTKAKTKRATAPAKPQISETEAYVNKLVTIAHANIFVPQPANLDENWQQQYQEKYDAEQEKAHEYAAWLKRPESERGDEPEGVSQLVKDAAKMAQGRATGRKAGGTRRTGGGGGGGTRRNVGKHIEEFLASVEGGTEHTVAEVAKFKSSEYPDGDASPGAVAARLFPKDKPSTIEGFEAVETDGTRKIRKA